MDGEKAASAAFWSWDAWGEPAVVLAAVAIATSFLFGLLGFLPGWQKRLEELLDDKDDRADIKAQFAAKTRFDAYQARIWRLNRWLQKFFGPATGRYAFLRCSQIAIIYPILLFAAAWHFGGNRNLGEVVIFPEIHEAEARRSYFYSLLGLVFSFLILFLYRRKFTLFILRNIDIVFSIIFRRNIIFFKTEFTRFPLNSEVFLTAILIIVLSIYANSPEMMFVLFSITSIFFVVEAIILKKNYLFIFGYIMNLIATSLIFFNSNTVSETYLYAIASMTFFSILPVLNSIFDWASWIVTRIFLLRIARHTSRAMAWLFLLFELMLDLGAAVFFLVLLSLFLPNTMEWVNIFYVKIGLPVVDWRTQLDAAVSAPLTEGLLVTGMLATTLIPTVIHLTVGLTALPLAFNRSSRRLAAAIPDDPAQPIRASARHAIVRALQWRRFWLVPASLVTVGFLSLLSYTAYAFHLPFGRMLADLALWSTSWAQ
ncbi:hypothetical protein [Rhodobium gokarnense]|uniref:Uncharacterized protein n=1 Tax=Rhodobium gokarnense TaxID=364296 RepID=A0ABT3H9J2_9HYPH|nr:hypothetical protein [Rhodobium gokarnense]MCW2307056.1 hypothetical protein [Rhodobium gokarnense]